MNDKIKELAEQAGLNLPNNLVEGVNGPGVVTEKDKLAEFAELIVRECANYITEYYPHSRYEAFYMKKHFGVEE